ncbi:MULTISPECIES: response regulator [Euryhalocaulis]|uniref:response regulator n=1 Tax=Euryhalocaulis TaxID=1712422 RepID=UPI0003B780CE|nr:MULTISPECIES: response regulator [Euryhalocaulis]MBA4800785.1 response regulator [Euryhalocaulis sp.]
MGKTDRNLRVLVVEDNLINQIVMEGLLKTFGHDAVLVDNGREAVQLSSDSAFDLILMDLHMPEMDGYETTEEIRNRESNGQTPIIAVTADALSGTKERCFEAGMDGYVTKPVDPDRLVAEILRLTSA